METKLTRNILAVIVGFVVACIVILGIELANSAIYLRDSGIDTSKPEEMANWLRSAPVGVFLIVIVAYVVGGLAGGFLAGLISKRNPSVCALIVGLLLTIGGGLNFSQMPHPLWVTVISMLSYVPCAMFGAKWARRPTPMIG